MSDDSPFQSLNLAQVQGNLMKLYERIACQKGRVEIVSPGGECECVLISKTELDSLERALEVLSDSDDVRALTHEIEHVAQVAEPVHA
jgi:hypothetical protein